MLAEHCASLFQPQYVDGLLNHSHRILSFTTVADRAKALEETVTKMEEDHKAQIAELEARAPGTP